MPSLLPRGLYSSSPPEPRTRISNNPTLLYSWWCTIFSLVIIGFRLGGRYIRNERLFREDKVMAASLIPLMARMGLIHVVLIWGTNNVVTDGLTLEQIQHREKGARIVLAARIFYCMFIWIAKAAVTEFLKRMTERFWKKGYEIGLRVIQGFLVLTFCGVVVATLSECHPFSHYWQVVPDPGPHCRQGYLNLMVMGVADIITDILIVCFPIPIILQSHMPVKRKLSLVALFSMSIVLIGITGARMPLVINKRGLQQFRTVFASSEILAATIISNAIILGSFLRDRGIKKQKYKFGSANDSMDRRGSSARRQTAPQDSDEDLARSLGYRMPSDATEEKSPLARPAPVANLGLLSTRGISPSFSAPNWQVRHSEQSQSSQESDMLKIKSIEDPHPSPRTARRVSFFDVGGLLETGNGSTISPSPTSSIVAQDFAHPFRHSSRASTSTAPGGRSYPPSASRSSRLAQHPEDIEMADHRGEKLDLASFLSQTDEITPGRPTTSPPSRLFTSHLPPPTNANTTHSPVGRSPTAANRDSFGTMPSLKDAGGLLSSPPNSRR